MSVLGESLGWGRLGARSRHLKSSRAIAFVGMVGVFAVVAPSGLAVRSGAGATAKHDRGRTCPPKRSKTLDGGPAGQIYVAAGTSQRDGEQDRVYLCSYRSRRRAPIGVDDCFNASGVELTRFAGKLLGIDYSTCTPGGTTASIVVRRTRTGRRLRRVDPAPDIALRTDGAVLTVVDVTDLVVRADGALAWIVRVDNPASGPAGYQVRSSSKGTGDQMEAQGDDIAPRSLALAGSTLYWTQGGAARSAALP